MRNKFILALIALVLLICVHFFLNSGFFYKLRLGGNGIENMTLHRVEGRDFATFTLQNSEGELSCSLDEVKKRPLIGLAKIASTPGFRLQGDFGVAGNYSLSDCQVFWGFTRALEATAVELILANENDTSREWVSLKEGWYVFIVKPRAETPFFLIRANFYTGEELLASIDR